MDSQVLDAEYSARMLRVVFRKNGSKMLYVYFKMWADRITKLRVACLIDFTLNCSQYFLFACLAVLPSYSHYAICNNGSVIAQQRDGIGKFFYGAVS